MHPRQPSSKQWTLLPTEIISSLKNQLENEFSQNMQNGEFIVEGRIYPEEVLLRIGHVADGDIQQFNFEGSTQYKPGKENSIAVIDLLFQATFSMMSDFVENKEADLPVIWQSHKIDKKEVFLQHSRVNSSLEAEADKLLGISEAGLVNKDDDLQVEEIKTAMGLNEEAEDKKPTVH